MSGPARAKVMSFLTVILLIVLVSAFAETADGVSPKAVGQIDFISEKAPVEQLREQNANRLLWYAGESAAPSDHPALPQPTAAKAAGTGSISGTVTREGTPTLLENVRVWVYDASGISQGSTYTDALGTYTVSGLGTGMYFAVTYNITDGYIDELYIDKPCFSPWNCRVTSGTPIAVTDGVETSGIDFALAVGKSISGRVWEGGTFGPLPGIGVSAWDESGIGAGGGVTDASGRYTILGLPIGDYFVVAFDSTRVHVSEIHDDIPTMGMRKDFFSGTPVPVTGVGMSPIVNFELAVGGTFEGTVTEQGTGTPVTNPYIEVYDADGTRVRYFSGEASGAYTVGVLPDGSYFVAAAGPWDAGFIRELYQDEPCMVCDATSGTPISVTQPATTSGVNFELAKGGRILGTVTKEGSGTPVESAYIYVYDGSGAHVDSAMTGADGTYATVGGLPTGSYFVAAFDFSGGLISEIYEDTQCLACSPTSGTPVGVTAPDDTTGIDFELVPGGRIAGTVTIEGSGIPLTEASVQIFNSGGSLVSGASTWEGDYVAAYALPTGTYFARAMGPPAGVGVQSELYDDILCPSDFCDPMTGGSISVTTPGTTSGVDFDLPLGGQIAGRVTDANRGFPIRGITIDIFDSGGALVVSATSGFYGEYVTEGLANGTYYALAEDNSGSGYASELYGDTPCDGCDVTTGTAITIASTSTYDGIDFSPVLAIIFEDGFESGGTSEWSNTVGGP